MSIVRAEPTVFFGTYDQSDWQRSLNGLANIAANDALFGKKQSCSQPQLSWAWGVNADGTPKYQRFYAPRAEADRVGGRVSVMTWMQMNGAARTDPAQLALFNNEAVLAGKHNAYIDQFAHDVATWGGRLIIRLNPEANGWWEGPFCERDRAGAPLNGNTDGSFVRGWRYIVDRIRPVAPLIEWHWCCNVVDKTGSGAPTAADKLAHFYPGDTYVDWTGVDIYNSASGTGDWRSFQQIVEGVPGGWPNNTMEAILRVCAGKPWIIGEWGCGPVGGDKAAWITEMLRIIPIRFPFIKGICSYNVFNIGDPPSRDYRITTDPVVIAAVAAGVATPAYMTGGAFPLEPGVWTDYASADTVASDAQLAELRGQLVTANARGDALTGSLQDATARIEALNLALSAADAAEDASTHALEVIGDAIQTLARAGGFTTP